MPRGVMPRLPRTCNDCTLTWDGKGNVKDVALCPLHKATPKLLETLETIAGDRFAPQSGHNAYRLDGLLTEVRKLAWDAAQGARHA